jgi:broad specificity phosphatase PhoE
MSVLTLVRHGQASYMEEDYDRLSPLGEEQARKLGEFWVRHDIRFDFCFHGPARRHVRTAEIAGEVVRRSGLPWPAMVTITELDEFDAALVMRVLGPRLVEADANVRRLFADFEAHRHTPEGGYKLQKLFEAAARRWCSGDFDCPDFETWAQFQSRVQSAIRRIRDTAGSAKNVVAISSGGPISTTMAGALNLPPATAIELLWLSRNCSFSEFLFSGERFTVHSFNSIPHLDDRRLLTYR